MTLSNSHKDYSLKIKDFYQILPIITHEDDIIFGVLDGYTLAAPKSFWIYLHQDMSDVVNGCGPGGIGDRIIPDTAYGMSIKPACKIHDWMFTIYNDEEGFHLSNQIFIDNMLRINRAHTKSSLLKFLRQRRILEYHEFVCLFGRIFFYDNHISLYNDQTIYKKRREIEDGQLLIG